ncbi:MAG: response regulator [Victivallales bacterium]|nr:response regulator [Victivallales bacterium]
MTKKNILVIDDDQQILNLLKMFVESNDCNAVVESSAEKGLAMIRKQNFDAVLLDIMLPDGDGLEVLRNIQKIATGMPVIMITGGNDVKIAKECMAAGAADYITKPFDFEYLRTTLLVNLLK